MLGYSEAETVTRYSKHLCILFEMTSINDTNSKSGVQPVILVLLGSTSEAEEDVGFTAT